MEKYTIITVQDAYGSLQFHKVETDNLPDLLRTDARFNKHNVAYAVSGWLDAIEYHPRMQKAIRDNMTVLVAS